MPSNTSIWDSYGSNSYCSSVVSSDCFKADINSSCFITDIGTDETAHLEMIWLWYHEALFLQQKQRSVYFYRSLWKHPAGHISKKIIEMSNFQKLAGHMSKKNYWNVPFQKLRGHIDKKFSIMSCFWKVMGHRRQERAHMSQREQREGHRRQENLHMSSQFHRIVLPIFFNDKNYRLFGEYLTNTLWGYTISVKIMQ